jgi:DNA polymerase-3 subunit gamma/tau
VSKNKRLLIELTLLKICYLANLKAIESNSGNSPSEAAKKKISELSQLRPVSSFSETAVLVEPESEPAVLPVPESVAEAAVQPTKEPVSSAPADKPATQVPPKKFSSSSKLPSHHSLADLQKQVATEMLQEDEASIKTDQPADEKEAEHNDEDFAAIDQEKLLVCWEEFAEIAVSERKLGMADLLKTFKPQVQNNQVKVLVASEIQAELLTNWESRLISHIKNKLNLKAIKFSFEVDLAVAEQQALDKPFTNKEKFEALAKKNPDIRFLQEELGLDFEY